MNVESSANQFFSGARRDNHSWGSNVSMGLFKALYDFGIIILSLHIFHVTHCYMSLHVLSLEENKINFDAKCDDHRGKTIIPYHKVFF